MRIGHTTRVALAIGAGLATFSVAGVVAASNGVFVSGSGSGGHGGGQSAAMSCPGGMARLGQVFSEDASVFPGDPAPVINIVATIADDGFLVEEVTTGVHTGTHIDAPGHFIDGGRTIDELEATEFVWPSYVIDVRDRIAQATDDGFQLSVSDIRAYERRHGRIKSGSLVILQTGFEDVYGTPAYEDPAPGFSGEAVQWMVDHRGVKAIGSDTFGPDATSDADFLATYTILANDGVAVPGLSNLDALSVRGDIVIAPAVPLIDGSGYQTDPLACLGRGDR